MRRSSRSGETIAALVLFAAAAILMCGVVAFGAEDYAAIRAREQSDVETAVQYISTKVRSADAENGIAVLDDRLLLSETVDGREYVTELYICGDRLCELYHEKGVTLGDDAGLAILPAEKLSVAVGDGGFTVSVTSGGELRTAAFSPRCGFASVAGGAQ